MEPNEVMVNEEVIETTTEEIVKAGAGSGFGMAAGVGLGLLAGIAICKLALPAIARFRAKKAVKETVVDVEAKDLESEDTYEDAFEDEESE